MPFWIQEQAACGDHRRKEGVAVGVEAARIAATDHTALTATSRLEERGACRSAPAHADPAVRTSVPELGTFETAPGIDDHERSRIWGLDPDRNLISRTVEFLGLVTGLRSSPDATRETDRHANDTP